MKKVLANDWHPIYLKNKKTVIGRFIELNFGRIITPHMTVLILKVAKL